MIPAVTQATIFEKIVTNKMGSSYAVFARYCAHSPPISIYPGLSNGRPSLRLLVFLAQAQLPALFHLLFETQGWEVANRQLHVWRTISKFSWCSTAPSKCWTCPVQVQLKLVALSSCPSPLQGPSSMPVWAPFQICWGNALDAIVSPQKLYTDYPALSP